MECVIEPQNDLRVYVDGPNRYAYLAELAAYVVMLYAELTGYENFNHDADTIRQVTEHVQRTDPNITYDDVYRILSTDLA